MSLSLGSVAPFRASLPTPGGTTGGGGGTGATGATPTDTIDLRLPSPAGTFTAEANDAFSLRELLDTAGNGFDSVARYRVALRDDPATPGGGRLLLRGTDVTTQLDFTPAEFTELQFVAGAANSRTDLLVVARAGKPDGAGGLTHIADSRPVQLTAAVTGRRSLDAAAALRTPADADDADFLALAQDAAIYDGLGAKRPGLDTVGNFSAAGGDTFSLRGLFDAGANAFDSIARYRVALRDDLATAGGGKLFLRGVDVTAQRDFSPAEFNELQFAAGPAGSVTDLLVVARSGKPDGLGGLTNIIDSPPVRITATATGIRSVNAAAALRTAVTGAEAGFLRLIQDADIFDGLGGARPSLTAVGNVTTAAADTLSVRELFDAGGNGLDGIARYRVALRDDPATAGGGTLTLNGLDVTARQDFSPAEFNELQFTAEPSGAATELLVVARRGKPDGAGSLTGIVDSAPVPITVTASGTRSLNAAGALRTTPAAAEANFFRLAQDAAVYDGLGKPRPSLDTVGSFSALAGDTLSLRELFDAGANAFDAIARYRVALRDDPATAGGGNLLLDGADVSSRTDFTATEFNALQFVLGDNGSATDLLVVARSGQPDGTGGLRVIVDSPAIAITATAGAARSLNALAALRTTATAADAARATLAQDADVFDGLGRTRPGLTTIGNFTAAAADTFSLRQLFDAGANAFDSIARYRVALADPTGGATLTLRAGTLGSSARLTVVARAGTSDGAGGLTRIADSPPVEIAANVTGRRSLNAAPALRTNVTTAEAAFLRLAQDAAIFDGLGGTRPSLASAVGPADPSAAPRDLAARDGTYRSFGGAAVPPGAQGLDQIAALFAGAIGSRDRTIGDDPVARQLRDLLARLDAESVGAWRQSGGARTALAIAAYGKAVT